MCMWISVEGVRIKENQTVLVVLVAMWKDRVDKMPLQITISTPSQGEKGDSIVSVA